MQRLDFALTEIKFAGDDLATGTFSGYGAVFDNLDAHGDVIAKGAFRETLRDAKKSDNWPAMLLQHGGGFFSGGALDMTPIGLWTEMVEDDKGLKVEGKLADTPRGREVYSLLKMTPRPALNGLSIGYRVKLAENGTKPEEPRRSLKKIDLFEVSLVTFPANDRARVGAVKAIDDIKTLSEAEDVLREAGFSRSQATAFIARVKAAHLAPGGRGDPVPPLGNVGVAAIATLIRRNTTLLQS